jgi:hypothetical protein
LDLGGRLSIRNVGVEGFAAGARGAGDADGRFLAVFDIEILRSVQGSASAAIGCARTRRCH